MSDFGWYRVYEGPLMLRPGTDLRQLHARAHRVCPVCVAKLQLSGVPLVYEGPPDEKTFDCFYCGAVYGEERLQAVS